MVAREVIPEHELREGLRRQAIIRQLAQSLRLSKGQITDASVALGLSRSRIYELIKCYRKYPCVETLLRRRQRRHNAGRGRLDPGVEQVIQDCIHRYYLGVKEPIRIAALYAIVEQACLQQGLDVPCEQSIRRRVKRLPDRELAMAGKLPGPRNKRDHHPQHHIVDGYLDEVQIDHTIVDAMIDLRPQGLGVYRPWITLAIDVATRLIYGYYIGLRQPTLQNTCAVLLQGSANKTDWLRRRGFDYSSFRNDSIPNLWPSSEGLPKLVFTDRGKDFRSKTTRIACQSLGIEIQYRPPGQTHFGGHIERLIGTLMGNHKMLPGMTGSNVVERADYEPTQQTLFTLEEYEQWLLLEILRYHTATHSDLGCTPLQKFEEISQQSSASALHPLDRWRISYAFLERVQRKVRPSGITLRGRTYSHPRLAELDGQTVIIFYSRSDNQHVSLSLDGQSEHLGLVLQADGKPIGHQDIFDLKFSDPKRLAETKRLNSISRELLAEQVGMICRLRKQKLAVGRMPKVVSVESAVESRSKKSLDLLSDASSVGTYSMRGALL